MSKIHVLFEAWQHVMLRAEIVKINYGGGKFRWVISMLWCFFRYGAWPVDYVRFEYYKKSSFERNRYLTFSRYFKMLKHFGYYNESTHGKIAEYQTFAEYIHRAWIVADKDTKEETIKNFIDEHHVVFAKPNNGDQGNGVLVIKFENEKLIDEFLAKCKTMPYVVEGVISQNDIIAEINPSSLNTVRAFTVLKKDGSTQILSILLRVGKPGMHVDNWGSGGICYNIDLETGICDRAGVDKEQQPFIYHPGSNIQMVGFKLPKFEGLKKLVIELSQKVPQARFVGWDIAITSDGYELVEMNCPGGHDILQPFGTPYGDVLKRELC